MVRNDPGRGIIGAHLVPPPRPDVPPPPPPPSGGLYSQSATELRAELRAERAQRRLWEMRYLSLEHAVIDTGHDPYIPCPLGGDGCPLCAVVRRLRAGAG